MAYSKIRKEYISWQEMNKHLEYCKNNRIIVNHAKPDRETFGIRAYVEDKQVVFKLSYRLGSKPCTYICRKDVDKSSQHIDGVDAYAILQRYYKVPDFRNDETICKQLGFMPESNKFYSSAKPLLYKNDKYDGTRNKAIGYDLNSSYSYAMLQDMPDTSKPYHSGYVKEGEIGFRDDEGELKPIFKGYSLWIFPLMKSPFKRFVDHWYKEKTKKNIKAKEVLNYPVGYMQKTNPFLRSTIIYYANNIIRNLIDENTLYCNTDSIVSLKSMELSVGKELGQFKVEHEGEFAFVGFNYQWNYDAPSYRHVPKTWFKQGFDLLKDSLPTVGNIVIYSDYQLKEIDHESKKK